MSEKYQRPDYIRVVKAVCVEFGNNDDTWTWCYLDVREALTKAKELLMKLEPDERLVVGTAYCGQNLRVGEILELVPAEDYLEIGGVGGSASLIWKSHSFTINLFSFHFEGFIWKQNSNIAVMNFKQ